METYKITIPGVVLTTKKGKDVTHALITKKNGQIISTQYRNKMGGYTKRDIPLLLPKPEYVQWCKVAVQSLVVFKSKHPGVFPLTDTINLQVVTYIPTGVGRLDLSATYEGIQDVLCGKVPKSISDKIAPQHFQILMDDSYQYVNGHDGSRIFLDTNPRMELTLSKFQYIKTA